MSLVDEYERQRAWRAWPRIFAALPALQGQSVLDLGCGVGHQSAELVARGARVLGVDQNQELLRAARGRGLAPAQFRCFDLRGTLALARPVDGIWSSFLAAFFPDLTTALRSWATCLRPGGWIALTEIDDLFGHEPLSARTREWFGAYARDGLQAGRYDFHMGHKLRGHLEAAGFAVTQDFVVEDLELSFAGPALPEVVAAWRTRLGRMQLLQEFCGTDFPRLQDEFLACLARPDHRSLARVHCCLAVRGEVR